MPWSYCGREGQWPAFDQSLGQNIAGFKAGVPGPWPTLTCGTAGGTKNRQVKNLNMGGA